MFVDQGARIRCTMKGKISEIIIIFYMKCMTKKKDRKFLDNNEISECLFNSLEGFHHYRIIIFNMSCMKI